MNMFASNRYCNSVCIWDGTFEWQIKGCKALTAYHQHILLMLERWQVHLNQSWYKLPNISKIFILLASPTYVYHMAYKYDCKSSYISTIQSRWIFVQINSGTNLISTFKQIDRAPWYGIPHKATVGKISSFSLNRVWERNGTKFLCTITGHEIVIITIVRNTVSK